VKVFRTSFTLGELVSLVKVFRTSFALGELVSLVKVFKTSFALGELVSLVKVFRVFRLEMDCFGVPSVDTTIGRCVQHIMF
jgi:hypothetical protein